jgi:hypothetical protein
MHIRFIYGIFGRKITIYTVIYGVYIRYTVLANPIHAQTTKTPATKEASFVVAQTDVPCLQIHCCLLRHSCMCPSNCRGSQSHRNAALDRRLQLRAALQTDVPCFKNHSCLLRHLCILYLAMLRWCLAEGPPSKSKKLKNHCCVLRH